jgi:hypothetical protein
MAEISDDAKRNRTGWTQTNADFTGAVPPVSGTAWSGLGIRLRTGDESVLPAYRRTRKLFPVVFAHALADIVPFVV